MSDTGYSGVLGAQSRSGDREIEASTIEIDTSGDRWADGTIWTHSCWAGPPFNILAFCEGATSFELTISLNLQSMHTLSW